MKTLTLGEIKKKTRDYRLQCELEALRKVINYNNSLKLRNQLALLQQSLKE